MPDRLVSALANVDGAATDLRKVVGHFDRQNVPERTAAAISGLESTLASARTMLDRIQADGGVIQSAENATRSVDGFGVRAAGASEELERTLRDLGDAARSIRSLSDAIEREPDMLLKGRAKAKGGSR